MHIDACLLSVFNSSTLGRVWTVDCTSLRHQELAAKETQQFSASGMVLTVEKPGKPPSLLILCLSRFPQFYVLIRPSCTRDRRVVEVRQLAKRSEQLQRFLCPICAFPLSLIRMHLLRMPGVYVLSLLSTEY
jgi:hypothetical protein